MNNADLSLLARVREQVLNHGGIGNHGHRKPGSACAECQLVNELEGCEQLERVDSSLTARGLLVSIIHNVIVHPLLPLAEVCERVGLKRVARAIYEVHDESVPGWL